MSNIDQIASALLKPDLWGPMRIPREGAGERTGLGILRATHVHTSAAAATVYWASMRCAYDVFAYAGTAASSATAIGVGTAVPTGMSFPAMATIADMNLTAGCMTIEYTGKPIDASGTLLLGTFPNVSVAANIVYDQYQYAPGVMSVPVNILVNKPMRVSMRKISNAANEFITTNSILPDVEAPIILAVGLTVGTSLRITWTIDFEYRSVVTGANIIPFEGANPSYSKNLMEFNDANANIAQSPSTVTMMDEKELNLLRDIGHSDVWSWAQAAGIVAIPHVGQYLYTKHQKRAASGQNLLPI